MKRDYRQPLVILSPKGILRLPAAASALSELDIGTSFQAVVDDPFISDRESVKRVVFLSGKMYYDLILQRKERKLDDSIAFIRLEVSEFMNSLNYFQLIFQSFQEITPFPYSKLQKIIESYSSATSFAWAQEGPENAEFYSFVAPRLSQILPNGNQ